ncbi:MAG TPA: septum formation initiator family protein [Candidatus Latescibacteria bacterium]|nr:septum formation initiator family protein [Candidatus Latescibacterota bacterium]
MRGYKTKAYRYPLKKRVTRIVLSLSILFLVYIFLIRGDYGLYQIWQLKKEVAVLKGEIGVLKREEAELKRKRQLLLSDLDYIEKMAREEYGMVKEGEMIYKVTFINGATDQ